MVRKAIQRLRKRKDGFTLVETLLALLIFVLLTMIVAMGIPVAFNTYKDVEKSSNAQITLSTTTNMLRNEFGMVTDVTTGSDGKLRYKGEGGYWISVENPNNAEEKGPQIYLWDVTNIANDENGKVVYTFTNTQKQPLVPRASITDDLQVNLDSITYSDGIFTVQGLKVIDINNNNTLASVEGNSIEVRAPFCKA